MIETEDALRASGDRARGVATVRPGVARDELAEMHEAGVRGVRFNFVRRLADPRPDDYYRGLVDLIAEFGAPFLLDLTYDATSPYSP